MARMYLRTISFVFERRKWHGLWCFLLTRPEKPFLYVPSFSFRDWSECVLRICQPLWTSFTRIPVDSYSHPLIHVSFFPSRVKSRAACSNKLCDPFRMLKYTLRMNNATKDILAINFRIFHLLRFEFNRMKNYHKYSRNRRRDIFSTLVFLRSPAKRRRERAQRAVVEQQAFVRVSSCQSMQISQQHSRREHRRPLFMSDRFSSSLFMHSLSE